MTNTDEDRTVSIVVEFTVVDQTLVTFVCHIMCFSSEPWKGLEVLCTNSLGRLLIYTV